MRAFQGIVALAVAVLAAPAWAKDEPAGTAVICKDGSTSTGGKGACSGHGGVDKKATKAAKKDAAAASSSAAASGTSSEETVVCKDGTSSKAGRGACRGHGGVDKTAATAGKKESKGGATAAPASTTPAPSSGGAAATNTPARTSTQAPAAATETKTNTAPANAKNTDPTGAIAKCKDGTYSHAKGHTGACSRHGGVAEWLDKK